MQHRSHYVPKTAIRQAKQRTNQTHARWSRRARQSHLGRGDESEPFAPPERWFEPTDEETDDYRIVVESPGKGYRHVLTPQQIRNRLRQVPQHFLRDLEVVHLSQMTRKKCSFPCYGMQWGATLYLYPLEEASEEVFYEPPRPEVVNEVKMYGGRWDTSAPGVWRLVWSQEAIEDFYLNNILIHELGHLVDERNEGYAARERYAEWFAIEHGYRSTGGSAGRRRKSIRRRHHRV